jgi:hypothetical protein
MGREHTLWEEPGNGKGSPVRESAIRKTIVAPFRADRRNARRLDYKTDENSQSVRFLLVMMHPAR